MFTIVTNARFGALGSEQTFHVVISGETIAAILDGATPVGSAYASLANTIIDAEGRYLFPGLIDGHTHPLGAAGEGGPATRAAEIPMESFLTAGITSVVGMLGLDDFSRSVASLIARARALRSNGLSAYCLTGSYRFPPASLGEDTAWDLYFIPEIIGVGEIAISDVRSSAPQTHELRRLVQESFAAASSAGKRGVVLFHIGDESSGLDPIFQLLENSKLDSSRLIATHINRNPHLLSQAPRAVQAGVWCDLTAIEFETFPAGFARAEDALVELLRTHPSIEERITVTSDCGTFVGGHRATSPASLYRAFCRTASNPEVGVRRATKIFMENPARCFGLGAKGVIKVGADADLMVCGKHFEIDHLICRGKHVIVDGRLATSEALGKDY
jgi:beta-aspartyl-dipeptidase (metallo-type)